MHKRQDHKQINEKQANKRQHECKETRQKVRSILRNEKSEEPKKRRRMRERGRIRIYLQNNAILHA